jgi:hypothetical protein
MHPLAKHKNRHRVSIDRSEIDEHAIQGFVLTLCQCLPASF